MVEDDSKGRKANSDQRDTEPRCGQCREVCGDIWSGFCYCSWLNQRVYAGSLMCPHGKDLLDVF